MCCTTIVIQHKSILTPPLQLCKRSAEHIMDLLGVWKQLYTLRYVPITIIQPLFAAGTIYLLSGVQATSGIRVAQKELKHSVDSLKLLIGYLREMGKSWQCALNIESILRALVEEQLKPAIQKRQGMLVAKEKASGAPESDRRGTYVTNPPSRRLSQTSGSRKGRSRQSSNPSSNPSSSSRSRSTTTGPQSPTIAVHLALDADTKMADGTFAEELLSPWSTSPSSSSPIPINRPRSRSTGAPQRSAPTKGSPISNGTLRPSTSSIPSPTASWASAVTTGSPTMSFFQDTTSMSMPPPSPLQTMHSSTPSMDQEAFYGMFNSFDVGTGDSEVSTVNHYDYDNFEMSRYFAMPSDQNLSIAPFVGPFTIGEAVGSLRDMPQSAVENRGSPEGSFDLSAFIAGPSGMDYNGRGNGNGNGEASGSVLNGGGGFYGSQYLSGGSPIVPNMPLHRRAASEDSRPARFNGNGSFDGRGFVEYNPGF